MKTKCTPNHIFQGKGHRPVNGEVLQQQRAKLKRQATKTTPRQQPAVAKPIVVMPEVSPGLGLPVVTATTRPIVKAEPPIVFEGLSGLGNWLVNLPLVKGLVKYFSLETNAAAQQQPKAENQGSKSLVQTVVDYLSLKSGN